VLFSHNRIHTARKISHKIHNSSYKTSHPLHVGLEEAQRVAQALINGLGLLRDIPVPAHCEPVGHVAEHNAVGCGLTGLQREVPLTVRQVWRDVIACRHPEDGDIARVDQGVHIPLEQEILQVDRWVRDDTDLYGAVEHFRVRGDKRQDPPAPAISHQSSLGISNTVKMIQQGLHSWFQHILPSNCTQVRYHLSHEIVHIKVCGCSVTISAPIICRLQQLWYNRIIPL